jgi:hypothetical protein
MKRIFYWIMFAGLAVVLSQTPASAQESKYKLKVKGPAAAAYVRHHGYPSKASKSKTYRTQHHSYKKTAYVAPRKHISRNPANLHSSTAYKKSSRSAYASRHQSSYGRRSAAYYTGHRSAQRWDKVKVKRKKDKLIYKFKKDS